VGEVGDEPDLVGIGVANGRIELCQALVGTNVIDEFLRRRQNFPEIFDVLIGLEKCFARFRIKEASIDKAL
jgi:hypothetical protein